MRCFPKSTLESWAQISSPGGEVVSQKALLKVAWSGCLFWHAYVLALFTCEWWTSREWEVISKTVAVAATATFILFSLVQWWLLELQLPEQLCHNPPPLFVMDGYIFSLTLCTLKVVLATRKVVGCGRRGLVGFVMSARVEWGDLQVVFSLMSHLSIKFTLRSGSKKVGTHCLWACEASFGENFSVAPWGSKDL